MAGVSASGCLRSEFPRGTCRPHMQPQAWCMDHTAHGVEAGASVVAKRLAETLASCRRPGLSASCRGRTPRRPGPRESLPDRLLQKHHSDMPRWLHHYRDRGPNQTTWPQPSSSLLRRFLRPLEIPTLCPFFAAAQQEQNFGAASAKGTSGSRDRRRCAAPGYRYQPMSRPRVALSQAIDPTSDTTACFPILRPSAKEISRRPLFL